MPIKKIKAILSKGDIIPKAEVVVKKTTPKKVEVKKVLAPKAVASKKPAAPKKTVVKKVSTTKVVGVKKPAALKRLVVSSDSESFWVTDGQVLNSLVALEAALKLMKPVVFKHHVSTTENHFADWVETVLGDVDCANDLRKVKTAPAAYKVVVTHSKYYSA